LTLAIKEGVGVIPPNCEGALVVILIRADYLHIDCLSAFSFGRQ
jgi:hypothetical protein